MYTYVLSDEIFKQIFRKQQIGFSICYIAFVGVLICWFARQNCNSVFKLINFLTICHWDETIYYSCIRPLSNGWIKWMGGQVVKLGRCAITCAESHLASQNPTHLHTTFYLLLLLRWKGLTAVLRFFWSNQKILVCSA